MTRAGRNTAVGGPIVGYICLDCHNAGEDTFRRDTNADCPEVGPGDHASWWPLVTVEPDQVWVTREVYDAVARAWDMASEALDVLAAEEDSLQGRLARLVVRAARSLLYGVPLPPDAPGPGRGG